LSEVHSHFVILDEAIRQSEADFSALRGQVYAEGGIMQR